ncbi:LamG-like jellyroll fold domain-containing protein [Botrimarina hoheduenensis]|uniref:LamG-like jellyroll fold domain-containing protein n=1 Tax=Botrimarina hoheduenensis TaxID=2528000 RepID=A0A5C5W8H8_9BACT|nr:LamG-like jellyroll fold domain-containing protein [Botrimarina hoheduenensis]TWT47196.1 hypothetical protein Pla111_08080 [Botrimarina hoheduenensis]
MPHSHYPSPPGEPGEAVAHSDQNDQSRGVVEDLDSLLEQHALGELGPAGWQRLGEIIRGDRSAALRYVQAVHDSETLRDESGGTHYSPLAPPIAVDEKLWVKPTREKGSWSLARVLPWGLAIGAAFLAAWELKTPPSELETRAPVESRPAIVLAEPQPSVSLGRITGLTPVASSDGLLRPLTVGSPLGRGEVFQLARGVARLQIGGGEVLVQGPAELSAIEERTVFLRHGQITVRHPEGMTIQTPVALATGGSEFVVVAEADDRALVTVLRGKVLANTSPDRGRSAADANSTLSAGQTMEYLRDKEHCVITQQVDAPSEGLLLSWDDTAKRLNDYERLVLSDEPLAYWPLYRVRRHRAVLDLTQNGYDGHAIGNWPTELSDVDASQPRGAYFDGESYIESDRKPPINLRTGFSIESWARVSGGPEYQAIFTSRWVLASNTDSEQCFGVTLYAGDNDRWQCWTGSGQYGRNWDKIQAPTPIMRNRWTHVAATFEPDIDQENATQSITGLVSLYIDGIAVSEARHALSLEEFEWPARIGAAEFVPKSLTSWLFHGELRDVAVYDHVLPANRVNIHAEQGRSAI